MSKQGAQHGNKNAVKEDTGYTLTLYLSGEDYALVRQILSGRAEDASHKSILSLARKAAKAGIYQLVDTKKREIKCT